MVYPISKFLLFFPSLRLLTRKINGIENIPSKGPFIIVSREKSSVDSLLIIATLLKKINKKVHTLSNPRFWRLFGDTICRKWAGCIPVDAKNRAGCLEEALSILKKGEPVLLYPTGSSEEKRPKTGVSRLHIWSRAKLLPIKMEDSDKIFPKGKLIPNLRKQVVITIGKPFSFDIYFRKKVTKPLLEKIANEVMKKIDSLHD